MAAIKAFEQGAVLAELDGGVPLILDPRRPTIYISMREFLDRGRPLRRFGLIADAGQRVNGTALFQAPEGCVERLWATALRDSDKGPELEYTDAAGHLHQLWAVEEAAALQELLHLLNEQTLLDIELAPCPADDFRPAFLLNLNDSGCICRVRHYGVCELEGFDAEQFIYDLHSSDFQVININRGSRGANRDWLFEAMAREDSDDAAFGLLLPKRFFLLRLPKDAAVLSHLSPELPPAGRALDVHIARKLLFEQICGLRFPDSRLEQLISRDNALAKVENGSYRFALLLNTPPKDELRALIAAGLRLPERSISLYPTLPQGLRRDA